MVKDKTSAGLTKINQYVLIKALGKGQFGKVKLCLDTYKGNAKRAMKIISRKHLKKQIGPQKGKSNAIQNEIAILKKMVCHLAVTLEHSAAL